MTSTDKLFTIRDMTEAEKEIARKVCKRNPEQVRKTISRVNWDRGRIAVSVYGEPPPPTWPEGKPRDPMYTTVWIGGPWEVVNEWFYCIGSAKRCKTDDWNLDAGIATAIARALKSPNISVSEL
jgi:hypothetical protein